jgi:hypothetical protein
MVGNACFLVSFYVSLSSELVLLSEFAVTINQKGELMDGWKTRLVLVWVFKSLWNNGKWILVFQAC